MERPDDLDALAELSSRIGSDPLIIQGAGGNTSVKSGSTMWIKASGTQLKDAKIGDIFVPIDLAGMRRAFDQNLPEADTPAEFILAGELRPSIETSLHTVFSQRIVVHVHCVNTIALAICEDARTDLSQKLQGMNWAFAGYQKPGAELAREVAASLSPNTNIIVLENHGLIVAADSVGQAEQLLDDVIERLRVTPASFSPPDMDQLQQFAGAGYVPLTRESSLHGVAMSSKRTDAACGGSLYPDHVLFCGIGATKLLRGETPADVLTRLESGNMPVPCFLLIEGVGALIREDSSATAVAMTQCLGDVLLRAPEDANLLYLSRAQNDELLDWDAEKYRKSLNG